MEVMGLMLGEFVDDYTVKVRRGGAAGSGGQGAGGSGARPWHRGLE
jgi:hypothetical protein